MRILLAVVALTTLAFPAKATPLYVDNFSELSSAIKSANSAPGSIIYLAPGTYSGGALPLITASMTLQLDPAFHAAAGAAILKTTPTNSKGLLTVPTVANVNLTVNGLTFENASISATLGGNAAGIRDQATGASSLTVLNSTFLHNQNGILTGNGLPIQQQQLVVKITNSLFANNGGANGMEHGLYISGHSVDISGSTFCGTIGGHDIKSRTAITTVSSSNLYDGLAPSSQPLCSAGSTSYAVDAPNGGLLTLANDLLSQGSNSPNKAIVSYGEEGLRYTNNAVVASGDFFKSTISGRAIQELALGTPTCLTPVQFSSTTFSSNLTPITPAGCSSTFSSPAVSRVLEASLTVDEPKDLALFIVAVLFLLISSNRHRSTKRLELKPGEI